MANTGGDAGKVSRKKQDSNESTKKSALKLGSFLLNLLHTFPDGSNTFTVPNAIRLAVHPGLADKPIKHSTAVTEQHNLTIKTSVL